MIVGLTPIANLLMSGEFYPFSFIVEHLQLGQDIVTCE